MNPADRDVELALAERVGESRQRREDREHPDDRGSEIETSKKKKKKRSHVRRGTIDFCPRTRQSKERGQTVGVPVDRRLVWDIKMRQTKPGPTDDEVVCKHDLESDERD
jgi:hypothetical protein